MRFHLEHHFDAPVERVERAVLEPDFQERLLDLPNVGHREVTELTEHEDGTVRRVVAYTFGGELPGPVQKVVGGKTASWDEVGVFDPGRHEWRFVIRPRMPVPFECAGSYLFKPNGGGTLRGVEVDLTVKVPVVGRLVENAIRDGLVKTMDAEAAILADYLTR